MTYAVKGNLQVAFLASIILQGTSKVFCVVVFPQAIVIHTEVDFVAIPLHVLDLQLWKGVILLTYSHISA